MVSGRLALTGFQERLREHLGLHLEGRDRTVSALLAERVRASGARDETAYLSLLDDPRLGPAEFRVLSDRLAVGESYFFRNREQLDLLVQWAGRNPGRLRVLSAGCAAGEEPYTLAMLAQEAGLSDRLEITAVDASDELLAAARLGRYSRWGLRATPDVARDRWFTPEDGGWRLSPDIRSRVRFVRSDLVAAESERILVPGGWDAILCRNVIIYLTAEATRSLVERLAGALRPGGLLFLGYAESLLRRPANLELVHVPGSFHYRRLPADGGDRTEAVMANWWEVIADSTERVAARVQLQPAGQGEPPTSARVSDQVLEALRAERYSDALRVLESVDASERSDPELALLEAAVRFDLNQLGASIDLCRRALDESGPDARLHYLLAKGLDQQGHQAASLAHLEMAARLDPGFALPHLHAGRIYRAMGDTEGAVAALKRAEELLPQEADERLLVLAAGFGRGALLGLAQRELKTLEDRR